MTHATATPPTNDCHLRRPERRHGAEREDPRLGVERLERGRLEEGHRAGDARRDGSRRRRDPLGEVQQVERSGDLEQDLERGDGGDQRADARRRRERHRPEAGRRAEQRADRPAEPELRARRPEQDVVRPGVAALTNPKPTRPRSCSTTGACGRSAGGLVRSCREADRWWAPGASVRAWKPPTRACARSSTPASSTRVPAPHPRRMVAVPRRRRPDPLRPRSPAGGAPRW